ncbi:MAG: GEVED domain-containing protein [Cellulophaga sp.]
MTTIKLKGQCPGPGPCPSGTFVNTYERIDPSSIVGAIFCSGQTRTFTITVGPGTTNEAATGDIEFITLFFDFDCDGVFEYSVNDSCSYVNPGGCSVNLSVVAPTVLTSTVFNARAHLVYNTATTDPCANLPGTTPWGDIIDFTITVNLPPDPALTSNDLDNIVCSGDSVTYTATDGDQYEFYVNGTSVQAQSTTNTFTTSSLVDGDIVTVRALDNANGCDTFSSGITMSVKSPFVTVQPVASQTIFAGTNTFYSVTTSDVDTFQWQLSTDGGSVFNDISDGSIYSGTTTASLTIVSPDIDMNNNLYRVVASNVLAGCSPINSTNGLLIVRVRFVITNRRITYRVKKN